MLSLTNGQLVTSGNDLSSDCIDFGPQAMILEYLATECMEGTLLSVLGNHPLVIDCLNASVHDYKRNETTTIPPINPPILRAETPPSVMDDGEDASDVSMDEYIVTPVKSPQGARKLALTFQMSIDDVIGRLERHLTTLRWRKGIMDLIECGDILAAKKLIIAYLPDSFNQTGGLLSEAMLHTLQPSDTISLSSVPLAARLDCQSFVELVRAGDHKLTLEFCRDHLGLYLTSSKTHLLAKHLVNHVCGLIAYPDPYSSPLAEYMELNHRHILARDVNRELLRTVLAEQPSNDARIGLSALERVVRQTMVAQMARGRSVVEAREFIGLE